MLLTDELLERARRLQAAHLTIDTHADIPSDLSPRRKRGETRVLEARHLAGLREGGFGAIVAVCGGDFQVTDDADLTRAALEALDALHQEAAESPGLVRICAGAAELERARADGVLGMLPSIEGAGCLRGSLGILRDCYRLGLRALGLTWNFRNELADGAAETRSGGGLTRFGVAAVKEMNRLGMLVDVSHMADGGVRHLLEVCEGPVIASHSNARAVNNHVRNLPDWAIEGIVRSGGVIGVVAYGGFVDKRAPSLDRLVDHVDYLKRLAGIDAIAFGPDYTDYLHEDGAISASTEMAGIYADDRVKWMPELGKAAQTHAFTAALLARGYQEEEIAKILGGNYLRVCRQVLGA